MHEVHEAQACRYTVNAAHFQCSGGTWWHNPKGILWSLVVFLQTQRAHLPLDREGQMQAIGVACYESN